MYNDLLTIGPFTMHGYGLMIAIGILVALIVADKRSFDHGIDGDHLYGMVLWTVVLGFFCAKILFIIVDFKSFLASPISFLQGTGFVVFGGIIGGALTIFGYCKIKKLNFIDVLDLVVPSVALAQGFGRIGCFLAGCCYGKKTDSFIGVVIPNSHFVDNAKRYPTQLMMAAGDFIIAALLFFICNKLEKKIMKEEGLSKKPNSCGGRLGLAYFALYSIGRFGIEFFRDDYRGAVGFLSTSQFLSLLTVAASAIVYYIVFVKKVGKKEEA